MRFLSCFLITSLCCAYGHAGTHRVLRVIDGDTLLIEDGRRIQLLGIDAPEINDTLNWNEKQAERTNIDVAKLDSNAIKAKEFIQSLIKDASVEIELDDINFNTLSKDAYDRTLAYVYIDQPDNLLKGVLEVSKKFNQAIDYDAENSRVFLNASLVKSGYAFAYSRYPASKMPHFKQLEEEAKKNKRGFWK